MRKIPSLLPLLVSLSVAGQGTPTPLRPDVTVEHYMDVRSSVSRMAYDGLEERLWYLRTTGDLLAVIDNGVLSPYDTVLYSVADHGINEAFGMVFHDSDLFVVGNQVNGSLTQGMVKRAHLQPNGSRTWSTVVTTENYAWGGKAHGFNNVVVSPDGQFLFLNAGSRTDHGEVQDVNGTFAELREEAVTAKILRAPYDALDMVLPNNETQLLSNGQLFAWGVRNTYDMAFDAEGRLFGVENSGDHDDPEEMNWLREGHHYGFPWTAGGNLNPTLDPGYLPTADPLLNPGFPSAATDFSYDPGFPSPPNMQFAEPIMNMGPDADRLRSTNGSILDASDSSTGISTFTCHRSPLGLVFDSHGVLDGDLNEDAFMLSFTPGGDSTGFSPIAPWGIPVVPADPSEDLLHLDLTYDAVADHYTLTAERIIEGFYLPVDAELVGSTVYVIEYWTNTQRSLWKVNLPLISSIAEEDPNAFQVSVFPNPTHDELQWRSNGNRVSSVEILSLQGQRVINENRSSGSGSVDLSGLSEGVYFARFQLAGSSVTKPFHIVR